MLSLTGLHRRVNGIDKIGQIESNDGEHIGNITVRDLFRAKQNGNGPPETISIHDHDQDLGKKRLQAMIPDEIAAFPVGDIKEKSGYQVDDRQR